MPGRGQIAESIRAVRSVFGNPNLRRIELAFAAAIVGRYAVFLAVTLYTYHVGGVTAVAILTAVRRPWRRPRPRSPAASPTASAASA